MKKDKYFDRDVRHACGLVGYGEVPKLIGEFERWHDQADENEKAELAEIIARLKSVSDAAEAYLTRRGFAYDGDPLPENQNKYDKFGNPV